MTFCQSPIESVRRVVVDMAVRLRLSQSPHTIECAAIQALTRIPDVKWVASGYHRNETGGSIIVRHGHADGKCSVLLNPIDGLENYKRRASFYAASALLVQGRCDIHSFVYDGVSRTIREFSSNDRRSGSGARLRSERRRIVAIGKYAAVTGQAGTLLGASALRWYGSTTIAVLAAADGLVDIVLNKTKPWNLWWPMPLTVTHRLAIGGAPDCHEILSATPEQIVGMNASWNIVCTRSQTSKEPWVQLLAKGFASALLRGRQRKSRPRSYSVAEARA